MKTNQGTDVQASSLSERPRDGDHTLGFGGNGVEGSNREIEGVSVVASRADIPDGGGDGLSVVVVLDVDDFTTEVGSLGEVVTPVAVGINGNSVLGVRVVSVCQDCNETVRANTHCPHAPAFPFWWK